LSSSDAPQRTAHAREPRAPSPAATRAISSSARAATTTPAPALASVSAMAAPMPRPPPVTTAPRPASGLALVRCGPALTLTPRARGSVLGAWPSRRALLRERFANRVGQDLSQRLDARAALFRRCLRRPSEVGARAAGLLECARAVSHRGGKRCGIRRQRPARRLAHQVRARREHDRALEAPRVAGTAPEFFGEAHRPRFAREIR